LGDSFILASERVPVFPVEAMARNHLTDRGKAQPVDIHCTIRYVRARRAAARDTGDSPVAARGILVKKRSFFPGRRRLQGNEAADDSTV
jgi:hypothetical protein